MLRTVSIFLLISPLALLVSGVSSGSPQKAPAAPSSPPPPCPPPLGDSSWALGLRLYQALRSKAGTLNTLFSPLLLASSLQALGGGAGGTTAKQLQDLLKTPTPSKDQASALAGALKSVNEANGTSFRLHSASALFTKQAPQLSDAFLKESQGSFGLKQQPLGQMNTQKQLQAWAKGGMGGVEGTYLSGEIQAKAGALILANAMHFKGLWDREFNEETADRRSFLGTKYTKVAMIHRAGVYRHYEDMENMVQVLELGLWGGRASLVLLLPFHVEGLARLDKLLSLELMANWLEKTTQTSMAISLPKANLSSTLSLQEQLSVLGLTDAWDQKTADFSGASAKGKGKLHLGAVLHWASLQLGSEAGKRAAELGDEKVEKAKLFYADHSFIVLVRDNTTGALLLMGALDQAEGETLHDEL